jgi:hypothetical protein
VEDYNKHLQNGKLIILDEIYFYGEDSSLDYNYLKENTFKLPEVDLLSLIFF